MPAKLAGGAPTPPAGQVRNLGHCCWINPVPLDAVALGSDSASECLMMLFGTLTWVPAESWQ